MKKSALVLVASLAANVIPTLAFADDAASPISYNIGAVTDYRYRGISQTKMKPAVQGGVDYANGPIYVGTWLSTISWVKDSMKIYNGANPDATVSEKGAPVEWDIYGGTKGDIIKDSLTYDVGVLAYVYLGQKFHDIGLSNPDTGEFYGALTYGMFTGKVSISATPLFGVPKSKGSQYYDLSANFDLGSGFSLVPHVGYQNVTGSFSKANNVSYADYSVTLGKDFGKGLSASLQVVATDADKIWYSTSASKFTGRTGVVAGVKYAF